MFEQSLGLIQAFIKYYSKGFDLKITSKQEFETNLSEMIRKVEIIKDHLKGCKTLLPALESIFEQITE